MFRRDITSTVDWPLSIFAVVLAAQHTTQGKYAVGNK